MNTPMKRTIRRDELRKMVPLADSTIYEMERRGEFPKRFPLTVRCVVWDYDEVVAWIQARKEAANDADKVQGPDVHQRKTRPTKKAA
ncbi:AlpA family phage regulatory protein [Chromobacterium violaceum]|uniref:helix-turn-helix transcriptional regulator n=1 Tax=Chromobacterium violaceum TaxID=536 RepID=UPI00385E04C1